MVLNQFLKMFRNRNSRSKRLIDWLCERTFRSRFTPAGSQVKLAVETPNGLNASAIFRNFQTHCQQNFAGSFESDPTPAYFISRIVFYRNFCV